MSQSESDEPLLPQSSSSSVPLVSMHHQQPPSSSSQQQQQAYYQHHQDQDRGMTDDSGDPELGRPLGLTGLQNLGNTCYMNAGIQALSNCPQLTGFMTDCASYVRKPGLAKSFQRLIQDMWSCRRVPYVVPSGIAQGVKKVCPAFKGYAQHDAQEFLRCLLDQLHEELKVPVLDSDHHPSSSGGKSVRDRSTTTISSRRPTTNSSPSGHRRCLRRLPPDERMNNDDSDELDMMSSDEADDYETCDSGLSWDRSTTAGDHLSQHHHSLSHSHSHVHHPQSVSCSPSPSSSAAASSVVTSTNTMTATIPSSPSYPTVPAGYCDCDSVSLNASLAEPESGIYSLSHQQSCTAPATASSAAAAARSCEDIACGASIRSTMTQDLLSVKSMQSMAGPSSSGSSEKQQQQQSVSSSSKKQSSSSGSNIKYRSVISDIFDGKILSSVQCLTCNNVSTTRETFQDLSLSIPTREQLNFLRAQRMKSSEAAGEGTGSTSSGRSSPISATSSSSTAVQVSDAALQSYSWIWSWIEWIFSIFWGPTVTLEDCLSAFFSADELKGDNMYSCQKCKKLRNGIKYSRVLHLPDILCIHLKRFRHELMYSSKISSQVTFPLEGLDMAPYVVMPDDLSDDNCPVTSEAREAAAPITTYDLVSVICHHGTPASGHYTAYCMNSFTDTWYEFDDQYVTAVDPHQVAACEAYVLFYRKSSDDVNQQRLRTVQLIERSLPDSVSEEYYISNQWINRFNTFAEPGPISNYDFLCQHRFVQPALVPYVRDMCSVFSKEIWQYMVTRYGGGPECSSLQVCRICLEKEKESAISHAATTAASLVSSSGSILHLAAGNSSSISGTAGSLNYGLNRGSSFFPVTGRSMSVHAIDSSPLISSTTSSVLTELNETGTGSQTQQQQQQAILSPAAQMLQASPVPPPLLTDHAVVLDEDKTLAPDSSPTPASVDIPLTTASSW